MTNGQVDAPSSAPGACAPQLWVATWQRARQDGFVWWDLLAAGEDEAGVVVFARALRPGDWAAHAACVRLSGPQPEVASLSSLYAGAAWCEREAAEMLGITFVGLSDNRALLLRAPVAAPPLRHEAWLPARRDRPWPGGARTDEQSAAGTSRTAERANPGRRKHLPIGVPDPRSPHGGRS